jgi:hypothetical protein
MLKGIIKNNTNKPKNFRLIVQDNKKSQAAIYNLLSHISIISKIFIYNFLKNLKFYLIYLEKVLFFF